MRVLDLFSGIGGFSLGLERTGGFKTVAFCEIDPFCRRVLAKHWPEVPCYEDVRELSADRLAADGIAVDVICGGFPCQDISSAGEKIGIDGSRSGLWREFARTIGELRPDYVIVENVAALRSRGLDRVLGDLAEIGYDSEWHCIPACAVGAGQVRDRVWIIAYPQDRRGQSEQPSGDHKHQGPPERRERPRPGTGCGSFGGDTAPRIEVCGRITAKMAEALAWREWAKHWPAESDVARMLHGLPRLVDGGRARSNRLGNAVVPLIPEMIGRAILAAEAP